MPSAPRPAWLTELIAVVQQLCPQAPGTRSARSAASGESGLTDAHKAGRVSADPERGAGWFWLGLQDKSYDSEQLGDAYLAPAEGSAQHKYQLIETVQDGNVLRIRAAEHAPREGLFLWVSRGERGRLEKSLLDGLSSINRFDLISRFADGHADFVVLASQSTKDDAPERARAACGTPGVHLVWGPPGTGKTRVIVYALEDLIKRGKSVLLVSGTNIAVDNALERAFSALRTAPGTMVRIGVPHLTAIAENPAVCLETLIRERQADLERQRLAVQEQIRTLQEDPAIREFDDAQADLEGFDPDQFNAARKRLRLTQDIAARRAELDRMRAQGAEINDQAAAHARERDAALAAHATASYAREHLTAAQEEQDNVDMLESALRAAEAAVARLEANRTLLITNPRAAGVTSRFGRGSQKAHLKSNDQDLAQKQAERDDLRLRYGPLIASGRTSVASHIQNARPYTPESIAMLDAALASAQEHATQARDSANAHAQRIEDLQAQITQAELLPQATEADQDLVAAATSRDLPGQLARLPQLQQAADAAQRAIADLEKQHERLLAAMRRGKSQVSRGIIREAKVVATTLAMARMNPEVRGRDYDFVIVDEVAASCPPEVLCAAARAREGVTLLGDFMQNAPIIPDKFTDRKSKDPVVQKWYQQGCFALFGIRSARTALANPACVTLTTQYRFGRIINDLANTVAYDGLLQVGSPNGDGQDQKVILIDVDGLGDELTAVRPNPAGRGKWWPIGALLTQALAQRRTLEAGQVNGETAGILVPYKVQQELIQDFLTESDANPQIEVGTSHRFQGREFDTVVFDMVEDGRGWIASGDLLGGSYAAGGVRLFNVGITRARHKLYLIANGSAVLRAGSGPLAAIRKLLSAGDIQMIRACEILGLPNAPVDDPAAEELWHALRDHATLVDLYDEDRLPEALSDRIDQAEKSIWMWSPWVGKRWRQFLPHLRDAAARGVSVRPVTLPPESRAVNRHMEPFHEDVAREFPATIHMEKEHQKIIVIDQRLTFIGSMNVLSHAPHSRLEIMALFRGSAFAQRVLEHERTDQLADPPVCPKCGGRVNLVRNLRDRARGDYRLRWICRNVSNEITCDWADPFPDRPGTRNQPRSRR